MGWPDKVVYFGSRDITESGDPDLRDCMDYLDIVRVV